MADQQTIFLLIDLAEEYEKRAGKGGPSTEQCDPNQTRTYLKIV